MKIPYLLASIVATALVASPLAYSAPSHGAQVTHFNSFNVNAYGCFDNYPSYTCFYANAYDDFYSGQRQGDVAVYGYDVTYSYYDIRCSGPAYANVVSVNRGNGNSSINATLDPSSDDCSNYNVSAPVTLNVAGKYDGNYRYSYNGTGKETYYGVNYKYNSQNDYFGETFIGTNGFYTGTFTGNAFIEHRTERQKVK